jgi:hypothetical protein
MAANINTGGAGKDGGQVAWRERIPPNGGEHDTTPILPATVLADHLQASAAGLATDTAHGRASASVGTVGELTAVLRQLVASQQHISETLAQLAGQVSACSIPAETPDLVALSEVLHAAASAAGHSADALAAGAPLLDAVQAAAGEGARF